MCRFHSEERGGQLSTRVLMLTPCLLRVFPRPISNKEILCCFCYYQTIRKFFLVFVVSDGAVDYEALFDDDVTVLPDEYAIRRELHARPLSVTGGS